MKGLKKLILGAGIFSLAFAPIKKGNAQENNQYLKINISKDIANKNPGPIFNVDGLSVEAEKESKKTYTNLKSAINAHSLGNYFNLSFGGKMMKDSPFDISPQFSVILEPKLVEMPDYIEGSRLKNGRFVFAPDICMGVKANYKTGKLSGNFEAVLPFFNFDFPIYSTKHNLKTKIGTFEVFAKGKNFNDNYSELSWTGKPRPLQLTGEFISPFVKTSLTNYPKIIKERYATSFELGISVGVD